MDRTCLRGLPHHNWHNREESRRSTFAAGKLGFRFVPHCVGVQAAAPCHSSQIFALDALYGGRRAEKAGNASDLKSCGVRCVQVSIGVPLRHFAELIVPGLDRCQQVVAVPRGRGVTVIPHCTTLGGNHYQRPVRRWAPALYNFGRALGLPTVV